MRCEVFGMDTIMVAITLDIAKDYYKETKEYYI